MNINDKGEIVYVQAVGLTSDIFVSHLQEGFDHNNCEDGLDNDWDGLTDLEDTGCGAEIPGWDTPAATIGVEYNMLSGIVNFFCPLILPLGAIIILHFKGRKN